MTETDKRIKEIEDQMQLPDFWNNKQKAQEAVKELNDLKKQKSNKGQAKNRSAIMNIFSGAGGEDAEDFASMLFEMYKKYFKKKGWIINILYSNKNEHGGYKSLSFEVLSKGSYEALKSESGVHRLVRISPFNAKKQRHTSFVMIEVLPHLENTKEFNVPDSEIKIDFSKSGGPGGQNVNKRETSVRVTHTPSGISVNVDSERSQERNREKAMNVLNSKLHYLWKKEKEKEQEDVSISKTTSVEWGNQIRSYIFHPYKLIKDHRTGVEMRDVESVLEGEIEPFVEA